MESYHLMPPFVIGLITETPGHLFRLQKTIILVDNMMSKPLLHSNSMHRVIWRINRVPTVLMQGNSTNAPTSYQSLFNKSWKQGDHSICITVYHRKHVLSLNPFSPGLKPSSDFHDCGFCSCNLLTETNNVSFGTIHLSCLVSNYRNHLHHDSNPGHFFRVVAFLPVISSPNKQLWSWCHSSNMLSFWATETTCIRTQTQDNFWSSDLTFLKSLLGLKHKHAKCDANWFTCSWAISKYTYMDAYTFNFEYKLQMLGTQKKKHHKVQKS
jgi:hypothetical protein